MASQNKKYITTFISTFLLLMWLSPIAIVIFNALKSKSEIVASRSSLPDEPISNGLANLKEIFTNENLDFINSFIDSTIITVLSLLFLITFSSMTAWALVRSKKKWSVILFFIFLAAMVIPFQSVMLPLVAWFNTLGELTGIAFNRAYFGIILAYIGFGSALSIFMYHGFIKSIPYELEEAAKIDGCSTAQTFFKIVFPMLKPVTVTLLILQGIWIWNDFLLPLVILGQGNEIQTLPLGISFFIGSFVKQWELIMMCLILSILPVLILFLIGQKYIIKGMVGGSIK